LLGSHNEPSLEPEEDLPVTRAEDSNPDAAILNEIWELTGRIRDQRTQMILRSVIDAVALNPQPLPPRVHELLQAIVNALNPQPLPPGPHAEKGESG
jgi:hypothetical protein